MKRSKRAMRIASISLAAVIGAGAFATLAGCAGTGKDTLVIMTQELNGLYNPFYSTAGTDMDVVGQTQISMFSTDEGGEIAYGPEEPVVVQAFDEKPVTITEGNTTTQGTEYTFVIKKGIQFSDGVPLTINDVMFNLYVYLDPAYTGSTTMYSTDIVGLQAYRTQSYTSGGGSAQEDELAKEGSTRADGRIWELINTYEAANKKENGINASAYDVPQAVMEDYITTQYTPSYSYLSALWPNGQPTDDNGNKVSGAQATELARQQLLADYRETLRLFKEELESDYNSALDTFSGAPYNNVVDEDKTSPTYGQIKQTNDALDVVDFTKEVVCFMFMEGYITLAYDRIDRNGETVEDKNHIVKDNGLKKTEKGYDPELIEFADANASREAAINYVYKDKISSALHQILLYWATGGNMRSSFIGQAKDVYLHEQIADTGMRFKNIEGIKSLAHTAEFKGKDVTVGGESYAVASSHDEQGNPIGGYDVLRITINGTDPKAIWNFGFTVAPYHYYSDPTDPKLAMDIENNKFGVDWGSFKFHTNVLQGGEKNDIPVGAGAYKATDRSNSDNPNATSFFSDNIVYYKANDYFFANVEGAHESLHPPIIKKMRYQVVSSTNAINQLASNNVDFVEPQFTTANSQRLDEMEKKGGYKKVSSWQLGYGYIGINAGHVENINLRKAIMSAMNTELALLYYVGGEAANISWPMSLVSWAYPREEGRTYNPANPLQYKENNNDHDYMMFDNDETAKANIKKYMAAAGASRGDSRLSITFTIAGSNLTDHPCYQVFKHAMDLLNECDWDIELIPDTNALTKLATGSLEVWAAAWGSTIDPDMYQVYHKNSTATSVYAWGYREILASPSNYKDETRILNELAELIQSAREITSHDDYYDANNQLQPGRTSLYRDAMSLVLDLAVELPVYQRKTLYAFNTKVIDVNTLRKDERGDILCNSYSSPLSRIWEIDFVK
ncbi:MAG: hypothetical protein IKD43_00490 [Clostridia bacterium]|nr:hypothetical protein [Clostridia bacterium]